MAPRRFDNIYLDTIKCCVSIILIHFFKQIEPSVMTLRSPFCAITGLKYIKFVQCKRKINNKK